MDTAKNSYRTVLIHDMPESLSIGEVLSHIITLMYETETTYSSEDFKVLWDFSKCQSLHPFFVGATAILRRQYDGIVYVDKIPPCLSEYLNSVYFHSPLKINPVENDDSVWKKYENKTYTPICLFNPADLSSDTVQTLVQRTLKQQLNLNFASNSVISLLLGELIDNITEHSKSNEGYLFCQYIPSQKAIYVMICDTGISIYSSYASDKRYAGSLDSKESSGLLMALTGKSTKDRPESENRGYGISKSRKLVVEGLGGEFFILSGSAFAQPKATEETIAELSEISWNGTAILLKLPLGNYNNINIYNYIS